MQSHQQSLHHISLDFYRQSNDKGFVVVFFPRYQNTFIFELKEYGHPSHHFYSLVPTEKRDSQMRCIQ